MRDPLRILVTARVPEDFTARVKAVSPHAEIYTTTDLEANPALLDSIEVIYGSVPQEHWSQASCLKWVQTTWAGMDQFLTPEAIAHPAVITNARIHAIPITEHFFGMLLMLTHRLHLAYRAQLEQRWDARAYARDIELISGKTLGVVGLGAIGSHVAEAAHHLGMHVLGLRRSSAPVPGVERVYTHEDKHAMLGACDVLLLTLPLTPHTRHFMDAEAFAAMRPTARFFNIGRGATVDTDALVAALRQGTIAGAGLDVVEPEPLPADHPLWTLPNVLITPHTSGLFPRYFAEAAETFLNNLRRYLDGKPLHHTVDKQRGY